MTIETDTHCTLCGRCSLWCTCIGTFAVPCVDAGMHPRRGQSDEKRASDVNAELDRSRLPARIIHLNHIEGINS